MTSTPKPSSKSNRFKVIKTETDYEAALTRVEALFHAKPDTAEGNELEVLLLLIEAYGKKVHTVGLPDPLTAIRFRMDQQGLSPTGMVNYFGSERATREVLRGRRALSLPMIRRLVNDLEIPAEVFLSEPAKPKQTRGRTVKRPEQAVSRGRPTSATCFG